MVFLTICMHLLGRYSKVSDDYLCLCRIGVIHQKPVGVVHGNTVGMFLYNTWLIFDWFSKCRD
jgi:hypothetical protein